MYVGLIVRDEYERSMKTQVPKDEQVVSATGLWLSHEKLTHKKSHV